MSVLRFPLPRSRLPRAAIAAVAVTMLLGVAARAADTRTTAAKIEDPETPSFNAALLQFFDPSSSSLSAPLTYLWGQQLYHSISDLRGARISRLVLGPHMQPDFVELISTTAGSHDVAALVARDTSAQLTIWGVLINLNRANITLAASLTVPVASPPPPAADGAARYDWRALPSSKFTSEIGVSPPTIGIDRINFAPMSQSLTRLYGDEASIRCFQDTGCPAGSIRLYEQPSSASHAVPLTEGETLLLDLDVGGRLPTGNFVPVVRAVDQRRGWVETHYLDITPQEIFVSSRGKVVGRKRVGGSSAADVVIEGPKFLEVLDTRMSGSSPRSSTRWYLVSLSNDQSVWVEKNKVRAVWPANHINFIAGLYRYALRQYDAAYDEFALFAFRADPREENVALSLAFQFMAASTLEDSSMPLATRRQAAIALLDKAVGLTPYDDSALINRAYVRLGWNENGTLAVDDLNSINSDIVKARGLSNNPDPDNSKLAALEQISLAASTPYRGVDFFQAMLRVPRCNTVLGTLAIHPVKDVSSARVSEDVPPHFLRSLATQSGCFKVLSANADDDPDTGTVAGSHAAVDYILQPQIDATNEDPAGRGNKGSRPKVEMAVASFALANSNYTKQVAWSLGTSRAATLSKGNTLSPTPENKPSDRVTNANGQLATEAYLDAYTKLLERVLSSPPRGNEEHN